MVCLVGDCARRAMDLIGAYVRPIIRLLPRHACFQIVNLPLCRRFADLLRREEFDFHLNFNFFLVRTFTLRLNRRFFRFHFVVLIRKGVMVTGRIVSLLTK